MIKVLLKQLTSKSALFVLLTLLVGTASQAYGAPQTLRDRLTAHRSFIAEFTQQVHSYDGELVQEGQGVIKVLSPDHFIWQTVLPDEHLVQSDGNTVWVFNPLLEQVSLYSASEVMQDSPILLLAESDPEVWAQYRVRVVGERYEVTPQVTGGNIERFELQFQGDKLTELLIIDSQGQRSQFTLTSFTAPAKLTEQEFLFTIPADVDIDDQRTQPDAG
ncbi:outer membrane lipoprotein chaperone LolA [Corallincola spongiicola]|uniref:Outer-membrane lipoprotein carrier protein n=1 Tax=Corallincola spongiicola TaxID=2520508 RepID=A0ABY1WUF2_9GAMM|nr:outer membrane lipoprotein chaperone LolA [Corallincola spongiicola]TAA48378.1 outer membrane lipoprotein chaperone LolA [Corallincola spongiicola]